jgi:hypothetical protein
VGVSRLGWVANIAQVIAIEAAASLLVDSASASKTRPLLRASLAFSAPWRGGGLGSEVVLATRRARGGGVGVGRAPLDIADVWRV